MDAAWKRVVVGAVLWGSPVLITLGVIAIGAFLQQVRSNFGAMRSTMGITVVVGLISLALHAGYFMAPFVHNKGWGRELWALILMGLAALIFLGGGLLMLTQTSPGEDLAKEAGGALKLGLIGLLALAVYAGPIVVLLVD